MDIGLIAGLVFSGASLSFLFVGLMALLKELGRRSSGEIYLLDENQKGVVFLFDHHTLIDCTANGRSIIASSQHPGNDWLKLITHAATYFPDIQEELEKLPQQGIISLTAEDRAGNTVVLHAELNAGITRISISNGDQQKSAHSVDSAIYSAAYEELTLQREILSTAPMLVWRERANGDVIWANAAYINHAIDMIEPEQDISWPLPRLFNIETSEQAASKQRHKIVKPDGTEIWFDLVSHPDTSANNQNGKCAYATNCDSTIQAERTLRDFIQTLTKTFAHLPIGLAIFDNQRLLNMFNPALLDLTGLAPDALSMRPSLYAFLDALRDRNIIPEPKDYHTWRRQISEMERAATSGVYEETWNLPNGQIYRMIVRPHLSGGLALMIEDISSEITRTRRYRADIELSQRVIDEMDEGIAVFITTGNLVITNKAYTKLWGHDPAESLANTNVSNIILDWKKISATGADQIWASIEEFICTIGNRKPWQKNITLADGRVVLCRVVPLAGGATLVGFKEEVELLTPSNSNKYSQPNNRLSA